MEGESSKIIYSVRSWKQGGRYQNKTREDCIPVFADVPNILQKGRIYDWNVVVVLGPCGGECRCVRELIRKLCVIYWCWCRLGVMVDVDLRSRKCAFIRPGFFRILVQPFTLRGTFSRSCLKRSCEMFGCVYALKCQIRMFLFLTLPSLAWLLFVIAIGEEIHYFYGLSLITNSSIPI